MKTLKIWRITFAMLADIMVFNQLRPREFLMRLFYNI